MPEKVLLAGGAGFIGSYLAKNLRARGHGVVVYDSFTYFVSPLRPRYHLYLEDRLEMIRPFATLVRGDLRHTRVFRKCLLDHRPSRVVILAALPIADVSNEFSEEAVENNFVATVNALEVIRDLEFVQRVVYTSSSMVYGDFREEPCPEDHPCEPKEVYGASKLAAETMVKAFGRRFGLEYAIVRPSAVYGPTDINRRVTGIFLENALEGRPLRLAGGGTAALDFTYVEDAADGIARAALEPGGANEVFNITRGQARTLKDLASIVADLVPGTRLEVAPEDSSRPRRGTLSIEKARRLLGYDPKVDLGEGMRRYVAYLRRHYPQAAATA